MPTHKLPDDATMKRLFYQDGLSDKEIAETYNVSVAAVSWRWEKLGLSRQPWKKTATAIMNAAWPSSAEFKRTNVTRFGVAKELTVFLRWRLGDPTLSKGQLHLAKRFAAYAQVHNEVLSLDLSREGSPWAWVPRQESDGRLAVRWPEGRELPKGPHLQALTLPDEPIEDVERYRW